MRNQRLIVLKFGGSVLRQPRDYQRAVEEIYRWSRMGYLVVAVVSALKNTTDQLSRQVASCDAPDDRAVALLLATGEIQSAAMLGLELDRIGMPNQVCDPASLGLRTAGHPLDASLVSVEVRLLLRTLHERGVVVVPGFIGRNATDEMTLLGRGGSDLTALFLAVQLRADRCRLIKDVDGLYEFDPKSEAAAPNRFETLSWNRAMLLDESIVQHKAIGYAKSHRRQFEVGSLNQSNPTIVGHVRRSRFAGQHPIPKLRLALLGLGTVGRAVYQRIREMHADRFEIVAVAVNNIERAVGWGVPRKILTTDARRAAACDCDVVIELVGGENLPLPWIQSALRDEKHVVTANKSLIAHYGPALRSLSAGCGVSLKYSAAAGGGAPFLERIGVIANDDPIVELVGLLNGSTNFILDQIEKGFEFSNALQLAMESGFTERDPTGDLDGTDAAEKLVLLADAAGIKLPFDAIRRAPLTQSNVDRLSLHSLATVRQVARLSRCDSRVDASVEIEPVDSASRISAVGGAGNLLLIRTESGRQFCIEGKGAGGRATCESVIADLLQLARMDALAGRERNSVLALVS